MDGGGVEPPTLRLSDVRSNQTELPIRIWYPRHDSNVLSPQCKSGASTLQPPGRGGESAIRTREGVTPVPLATGCLEPLGHLSMISILQRRGWGSNPPALAGLPVFEAGRATLTRSPPYLLSCRGKLRSRTACPRASHRRCSKPARDRSRGALRSGRSGDRTHQPSRVYRCSKPAVPPWLRSLPLVSLAGIEPATSRSPTARSATEPQAVFRVGSRSRTDDHRRMKATLYHLSYPDRSAPGWIRTSDLPLRKRTLIL